MLRIRKVSELVGMRVFTDGGDYFGEIEEANLIENKVDSWRIKLSRTSNLSPYLGGARGLIVPHQYVKAIGDVIVVNKSALPSKEDAMEESLEPAEN